MSKSQKQMLENRIVSFLENEEIDEIRLVERLQETVEDVKCGRMKTHSLEKFREEYAKRIQDRLNGRI